MTDPLTEALTRASAVIEGLAETMREASELTWEPDVAVLLRDGLADAEARLVAMVDGLEAAGIVR